LSAEDKTHDRDSLSEARRLDRRPILSLAACSSGAVPDDYRPPIATLRGSGGLGTAANNTDLRLALVWMSGLTADNFPNRVAQDVAWKRTGPTAFEVMITDRPPAEVLQDGPVSARLLAYHDLNHNQTLDFASITDDAFTDELVAFNPDQQIEYNEVDGQGAITVDGMNSSTPITLYGSTAADTSCHLLDWVPRFAFEAHRQSVADGLEMGPWRYEIVNRFVECPEDAVPPDTTTIGCGIPAPTPPTPSFMYYATWAAPASDFISNTCGSVLRTCRRTRLEGVPVPDAWPCPCDPSKYRCVSTIGI
jgi:hypothetical protein